MAEESILREIRDRLTSLTDRFRAGEIGVEWSAPVPMVLARSEAGRPTMFGSDQILTTDHWDQIIRNYDPQRRVATVVCGFLRDESGVVAGPSHWVGPDLPPLGRIHGGESWHVDRDAMNLFGQVQELQDENGGRVTNMVREGFLQRSVYVAFSGETNGEADLWHLALLAEQPGIPNMPALDSYFRQSARSARREWERAGLKPWAASEMAFRTACIVDDLRVGKETGMTDQETRALATEVATAVAREIAAGLGEALAKALEPTHKLVIDLGEQRKKSDEDAAARADAQRKADEERNKAEAKKVAEARHRTIGARIAALVQRGTLTPGDGANLRTALCAEGVSDELVEIQLGAAERVAGVSNRITTVRTADDKEVAVDFQRYFRRGIDPAKGELVARALAEVDETKPLAEQRKQHRAAILRLADGGAETPSDRLGALMGAQ